MKQNYYSIYDKIAETFNTPFTEINNATAIRSFQHTVIEQQHKDDYVLYSVGAFDTTSGTYIPFDTPIRLLTGLEVQKQEVPEQLKAQAI